MLSRGAGSNLSDPASHPFALRLGARDLPLAVEPADGFL